MLTYSADEQSNFIALMGLVAVSRYRAFTWACYCTHTLPSHYSLRDPLGAFARQRVFRVQSSAWIAWGSSAVRLLREELKKTWAKTGVRGILRGC